MKLVVLVLALHSWCGDKKNKRWTPFKPLVSKSDRHGGWRELKVSINFYKKQCLPHIKSNKKKLSKQAVTTTYTLEKKFLAVATFEGLGVVSFQTE